MRAHFCRDRDNNLMWKSVLGGYKRVPGQSNWLQPQKFWQEMFVICENIIGTINAWALVSTVIALLITWSRRLSRDQRPADGTTKLPLFRARKMPPPWLMIRGSSAILVQKFQHQQQLQFSIASALCAKRWKEKSVPAYTSRFGPPLKTIQLSDM